jgi:hypothetical protein
MALMLDNRHVEVTIEKPAGIANFTGMPVGDDFYFIRKVIAPAVSFEVKYKVVLKDPVKCELITPKPAEDTKTTTGGLVTPYKVQFKVNGEKKMGGNIYFCPVDIVDKNKKSLTELKVGKMEKALTPAGVLDIDKDEDCFFVRISGAATLNSASIKLGTVENPDTKYNDDETEIEMEVDGNDLITKSMLLVSDDVDDIYAGNNVGADDDKNDRTHKIQLGGSVKINTVQIDGVDYLIDLKTPVKVKRVVAVTALVFPDSNITKPQVMAEFAVANERFAQIGIKLNVTVLQASYPAGITNSKISIGKYIFGSGKGKPLLELRSYMNKYGTTGNEQDLRVFYCSKLLRGRRGGEALAYRNAFAVTGGKGYANNVFINQSLKSIFTLPHEIGHTLTNLNHYGTNYSKSATDVPINLIRGGGTSEKNTISASKRLVKSQESAIQALTPVIK